MEKNDLKINRAKFKLKDYLLHFEKHLDFSTISMKSAPNFLILKTD